MVRVEKWVKKEESQEMKEKVEGDKEGKERGRKEKKGEGLRPGAVRPEPPSGGPRTCGARR